MKKRWIEPLYDPRLIALCADAERTVDEISREMGFSGPQIEYALQRLNRQRPEGERLTPIRASLAMRAARLTAILQTPGATRTDAFHAMRVNGYPALQALHSRLLREGYDVPPLDTLVIAEHRGGDIPGNVHARDTRRIATQSSDPNIPPTRLPQGDPYLAAADWLRRWGYQVDWRTLRGQEHPVVNDRLTNVAELVRLWAEERERRFPARR